jgi:hypothetical protein
MNIVSKSIVEYDQELLLKENRQHEDLIRTIKNQVAEPNNDNLDPEKQVPVYQQL